MRSLNMASRVLNTVSGQYDQVRAATTVKAISANAYANTIVWTPAAGKRIRVMGYCIQTSNARFGSNGDLTVTLLEQGGVWLGQFNFGLGAAATNQPVIVVNFPPPGILLSAPDKKIAIDLSNGLTAGAFGVTVWGSEE